VVSSTRDSTVVTGRSEAYVHMAPAEDETGRFRQRRRTRAAIVTATMTLLETGVTPSVAEIAEAADVSRRTVYLHFATLEQLLVDATLGLLSQRAVDEAIEAADTGPDVDARVAAMIGALGEMLRATLPLGRALIRLTVDAPTPTETEFPRRGYRRVGWIEQAIAPLRDQLGQAGFDRLVSSLAMVIGWEAFIVLSDLRGLPPDQQLTVSLWAGRALIAAALAEADPG
jgi:AcrR family transcriptional regulator